MKNEKRDRAEKGWKRRRKNTKKKNSKQGKGQVEGERAARPSNLKVSNLPSHSVRFRFPPSRPVLRSWSQPPEPARAVLRSLSSGSRPAMPMLGGKKRKDKKRRMLDLVTLHP